MGISKILKTFEEKQTSPDGHAQPDQAVETEIRALRKKVTACFSRYILPAIYDVERDLQQAGYWNQINIAQSSHASSDTPFLKSAALSFIPERVSSTADERLLLKRAYQSLFAATGDLRKIEFSFRFPERLTNVVEEKRETHLVEDIRQAVVDAFLEAFIIGALDAYQSDRILR